MSVIVTMIVVVAVVVTLLCLVAVIVSTVATCLNNTSYRITKFLDSSLECLL